MTELADAPLFGRYQPPAEKPALPPPTPLALTLHAVFVSPRREASFAVIGEAGAKPRAYGLNEALPGGAVVSEVAADRVVLVRDAQYETLTFKPPSNE